MFVLFLFLFQMFNLLKSYKYLIKVSYAVKAEASHFGEEPLALENTKEDRKLEDPHRYSILFLQILLCVLAQKLQTHFT